MKIKLTNIKLITVLLVLSPAAVRAASNCTVASPTNSSTMALAGTCPANSQYTIQTPAGTSQICVTDGFPATVSSGEDVPVTSVKDGGSFTSKVHIGTEITVCNRGQFLSYSAKCSEITGHVGELPVIDTQECCGTT